MEKKPELLEFPIHLFENIALTFSGGGYRAASFALGVLSYLNQVKMNDKPLLENVKGLSTVSGGTLTGATYAHFKSEGVPFMEFYTHFHNMLDKDQLLEIALKKFADNGIWAGSHKKRSLINAFSLSYEELLTNGKFGDLKKKKSHLEDICFNASDFSFGLAFRFQTSGYFGNYRLNNKHLTKLSKGIKLADAIAASSCFPMGFEPIIMPDDFISDHNSAEYLSIKSTEVYNSGVGLMDGGIIDNQGIGSIMKANKRRMGKANPFDLFMVCDVGSYFMNPWKPAEKEKDCRVCSISPKQLYTQFRDFLKHFWPLFTPLIVGAVLLITSLICHWGSWFYFISGGFVVFGLVATIIYFLIGKLNKEILTGWNWIMGKVPGFIKDKLHYFENIHLRLFKRMLEERVTSSVKMISEIFLKQLRRLNYDLFYKDENLKNRRITNLIYQLTSSQFIDGASDEKEQDKKIPYVQNPGDRIFESAKIASEMGTTLWFTENDRKVKRLENLVACGQYTTCYNLLKYCVELEKSTADVDLRLLKTMKENLRHDWIRFIENPYWLYDGLLVKD